MESITAGFVWRSPPTSPDFITIKQYSTIIHALERLTKSGISSAPIVDTENNIIGIVDLLDMVTFASSKLAIKDASEETLNIQMKEFQKPVDDIMNISGRNELMILPEGATLKELISKFSQSHVHKVLLSHNTVMTGKNLSAGIITQSKLVEFLFENKSKLDNKLKSKIEECWKIGSSQVESVNMDQTLLEAFSKIWEKKVSGLAVIDDSGVIVGNISSSDLKKVPSSSFIEVLHTSIKLFLNIKNENESFNMEEVSILSKLPGNPIIANREDTLEKVTDLMLRFKIHRVYVVDSHKKPIHVITMRDIIQLYQ